MTPREYCTPSGKLESTLKLNEIDSRKTWQHIMKINVHISILYMWYNSRKLKSLK